MGASELSGLGAMANAMSKQMFGAQVVAKTLNYMNGGGGASLGGAAPTDKQTFGAQVVSKTLDYMHSGGEGKSGGMGSMSQMFQFNKDVLGAMMTGKGVGIDTSV